MRELFKQHIAEGDKLKSADRDGSVILSSFLQTEHLLLNICNYLRQLNKN